MNVGPGVDVAIVLPDLLWISGLRQIRRLEQEKGFCLLVDPSNPPAEPMQSTSFCWHETLLPHEGNEPSDLLALLHCIPDNKLGSQKSNYHPAHFAVTLRISLSMLREIHM